MKMMNKVCALVLSVALCAGMAAPAFAYGGEPVEEVEQPVLLCLRRRFFFSSVDIGIFFLHQGKKVGFVHKIHKVDGLLPLGVAVDDQVEGVARFAD